MVFEEIQMKQLKGEAGDIDNSGDEIMNDSDPDYSTKAKIVLNPPPMKISLSNE
jgi:hypothetical protein